MKHKERQARLTRIQEGLIRSAAWMLEPSDDHVASATIVVASVLQDLVAVGGPSVVKCAMDQLQQLVKEGVLLP